jgi:hypothetical protein
VNAIGNLANAFQGIPAGSTSGRDIPCPRRLAGAGADSEGGLAPWSSASPRNTADREQVELAFGNHLPLRGCRLSEAAAPLLLKLQSCEKNKEVLQ